MLAFLLASVCCAFPSDPPLAIVRDRVDKIELNHVYMDGKLVIDQLIFWNWDTERANWVVVE